MKNMAFNQLVLETVAPILYKFGYQLIESRSNLLKFESYPSTIVIANSPLEKENLLYVGQQGKFVLLDDQILENCFDSSLRISLIPAEQFLRNVGTFFQQEGSCLLLDQGEKFKELEKYDQRRSKIYTDAIQGQQLKKRIDAAWETHEYKKFVDLLNQTEGDLSKSYKKKKEIAIKRMDE